jgi:hypothetical protein
VKELTDFKIKENEKCIQKAVMDIQARLKSTDFDSFVTIFVASNEELVSELISAFGIDEDANILHEILKLNETVKPLGKRKFMQSRLADDFFSSVSQFLSHQLPEITQEVTNGYAIMQAPATTALEQRLVNVDHFEPTLALLRAEPADVQKNPKIAPPLRELFEAARIVYGGPRADRKRAGGQKSIDLEVVTQELGKANCELAEALASLELLGLLRQPGAVDFAYNAKVKLRRVYKDTPLFATTPSDNEDD